MDVCNSVPPVSIAVERNALSHRREDSFTSIRRRRAATQSTTILKKEQITQMNRLQLLVGSTLFRLSDLHVEFGIETRSPRPTTLFVGLRHKFTILMLFLF